MKILEITENIDNLNYDRNNTVLGTKKVKRNLLVRILKKMTVGSFLSALGLAVTPGSPVLALTGLVGGFMLAGTKYKDVPIKVKGKYAEEYMKEIGLDKDLEPFYNKYFSENVIKNLDVNPDHIAAVLAKESGLIDTGASFFSLKLDVEFVSREQAIMLSGSIEMKTIRDHLYSASKSLEKIAEKHNMVPGAVSELFAKMYGDSPMNLFFKTLTG